jgi:3-oxosteroid 1-dehydrogenase
MSEIVECDLVIAGSGIGGMAAAIRAAELGASVVIVEKAHHVGGASAWSGGQVWVGANHVAARAGLVDSVDETLDYVTEIAGAHPELFDPARAREWVRSAVEAARWFEEVGVIEWSVIPDYPDYYFPDARGSKPTGRYLTGAPFDGRSLGEARALLVDAPHWPIGITYEDMFAWGGLSSRDRWDHDIIARRRADDVLTFGQGIAGWFLRGVVERAIPVRVGHVVTELLTSGDEVVGLRAEGPDGRLEVRGAVVLATGSHDWSNDLADRWIGTPAADGGSVAPASVAGDAVAIAGAVGAATASVPGTAAPIIPGYRLAESSFEGDTGFRACFEHCLPHSVLVNAAGERFCDDSFHPGVVAGALAVDDAGARPNLPFFMIWDERHHQRYGLGASAPGAPYPEGLVQSAPTLAALATGLGIDADGLVANVERFNAGAGSGHDPDFGRGSNLSVRRFRGDNGHAPNPNVGSIELAPFHGMRMRLLNTGIAAGGLVAGEAGAVLRPDGTPIRGLYAAGECVTRSSGGGAGYNSGYSLSRAMAYGYLAAAAALADRVASSKVRARS